MDPDAPVQLHGLPTAAETASMDPDAPAQLHGLPTAAETVRITGFECGARAEDSLGGEGEGGAGGGGGEGGWDWESSDGSGDDDGSDGDGDGSGSDGSDGSGSEESYAAFDLSDDRSDLRTTPRPRHLRQLLAALRAKGDEHEKIIGALEVAEALVRDAGDSEELRVMAPPLLRQLLHLPNTHGLPDFFERRHAGLVALAVRAPPAAATFLTAEFYSEHLSLEMRMEVRWRRSGSDAPAEAPKPKPTWRSPQAEAHMAKPPSRSPHGEAPKPKPQDAPSHAPSICAPNRPASSCEWSP